MRLAGRPVLGGAASVVIASSPFVARAFPSPWLIGAVAAAQVAILVWLIGHGARRYRVALAAVAFCLMGLAMFTPGLPAHALGLIAAGSCHAVAYGGLLAYFAASLRPGREPAVTGFARRVRRTMPDQVARYTRRVTVAWCVFFAAELATSAGLLAVAPQWVWSGFVGVANVPLVAAMMLGEFAVRSTLFRHEAHTGLAAMLAGLRGLRGARP